MPTWSVDSSTYRVPSRSRLRATRSTGGRRADNDVALTWDRDRLPEAIASLARKSGLLRGPQDAVRAALDNSGSIGRRIDDIAGGLGLEAEPVEAVYGEVETMLKRAVVVEQAKSGDRVQVGATVHVRNLASDKVTRFVIVGPTEANAADGRISSASPVGRSLLDRAVGDEVEVSAPAGTMRFRVEQIGE